MLSITNDQVLRLLDYSWKNIPKLITDSKDKYNIAPHHYTMQRIVSELIAQGNVEFIEIPYGLKKTKAFKLKDTE